MTYNKSPTCVDRWRAVLDDMVENEVVRIDTKHPDKLSYRLREALYAARHNNIEPYASLDRKVRIEGHQVIVEPRESLVESVHTSGGLKRFESVANEFAVIETVTRLKLTAGVFPDFTGDISAIEAWAEAKNYEITNTDPLTLRRREPDE